MRQTIAFGAICFALLLPKVTMAAETSTARQLLAQYVVDLQTAPDDQVLRERIIRLELTLRPSPVVPVEARRFFVKATIFQQQAADIKSSDPLAMAAGEMAMSAYREALLIAPWWPEAYYGLSTSLEASGRFNEAVAALNLYVITGPGSAGASNAEDKFCSIAVKRDRASLKQ